MLLVFEDRSELVLTVAATSTKEAINTVFTVAKTWATSKDAPCFLLEGSKSESVSPLPFHPSNIHRIATAAREMAGCITAATHKTATQKVMKVQKFLLSQANYRACKTADGIKILFDRCQVVGDDGNHYKIHDSIEEVDSPISLAGADQPSEWNSPDPKVTTAVSDQRSYWTTPHAKPAAAVSVQPSILSDKENHAHSPGADQVPFAKYPPKSPNAPGGAPQVADQALEYLGLGWDDTDIANLQINFWQCEHCLTRNPEDLAACPACENKCGTFPNPARRPRWELPRLPPRLQPQEFP